LTIFNLLKLNNHAVITSRHHHFHVLVIALSLLDFNIAINELNPVMIALKDAPKDYNPYNN